jgi:cyclopropane fatty-acyl-phospholipid synthase-like methyltransferase
VETSQESKVLAYYHAAGADYRRYWFPSADPAMHFGYYDSSVRSHPASLVRMNEVLADFASVARGEHVLDAGCGYGGTSIWLARERGCRVTGVSLVPEQVRTASQFAAALDLPVSFAEMNYTELSFPDSSFDVVWAQETLIHTEKKEAFFREAHRVLRPGGRLIIADYTLRESPPLTAEEKTIMATATAGWAMVDFLPPSQYLSAMRACGFAQVAERDITANVRPSVGRLGKLRLPTWPTANIAAAVGKLACRVGLYDPVRVRGIEAGVYQYRALRMGLWKETLLLGRK